MPAFRLNGIDVPARLTSSVEPFLVGEDAGRALSGTYHLTERARKRVWQFKSKPLAQSTAEAWKRLIAGDGHAWSFDSETTSSKGLVPNAGHTATIEQGGKYGKLLRIPASTSITWATNLGSTWTVVGWRLESGTWKHYVVKSNGHKWVDGVRNDAASTTFVSVSSGSLTLTGATSLTDFDDWAAFPFAFESDWPSLVYTEDSSRARALTSRLSANGDIIRNGPIPVLGEVHDSRGVPSMVSGSFALGVESFDFSLWES